MRTLLLGPSYGKALGLGRSHGALLVDEVSGPSDHPNPFNTRPIVYYFFFFFTIL